MPIPIGVQAGKELPRLAVRTDVDADRRDDGCAAGARREGLSPTALKRIVLGSERLIPEQWLAFLSPALGSM